MDQQAPDNELLARAFERALDLDPGLRAALIAEVRSQSSPTADALVEILEAHGRDSKLLDQPPDLEGIADALAAERPRNGPRRDLVGASWSGMSIVRHIGAGGMGDVYEARQDQPRRSVAIKVLADEGRASERFTVEAEALARLDHPNIARVFGAGTSDGPEGPFSWMAFEFIPQAMSLTAYADAEKLTTEARVSMYVPVCRAIHHAHQKGVLHRDLKPANLLVAAEGGAGVKVIDFGLARLLDALDEGTAHRTRHGELLGTLRYMSPEQCDGDPTRLDVRTDVYGLGVVLYELVAGRLPYDIDGASLMQTLGTIQNVDARDPRTLAPAIDGDLAAVLLHALEKHPDDRYGSAAELADDLDRWIRHEPIEARRAGALHRVKLFAVRRTALFVGLVAGGLAATVALATITALFFDNRAKVRLIEEGDRLAAEQAQIVEGARDELTELTSMLGAVVVESAKDAAREGATAEQQRGAVERAVEQLGRLRGRLEGDVESTRSLADAFVQVGRLLDRSWSVGREDAQRSAEAYAEGARLWKQVVALAPDDDTAKRSLFEAVLAATGACRNAKRIEEGRAFADEALSMARHAYSEDPEDADALRDLIAATHARGDLYIHTPPYRQGLLDAYEALELVDRLADLDHDAAVVADERSWAKLRLGFWIAREESNPEAGLLAHSEATQLRLWLLRESLPAGERSALEHARLLFEVFGWNEVRAALAIGNEETARRALAELFAEFLRLEGTPAGAEALGAATGLAALHADRTADSDTVASIRSAVERRWRAADPAIAARQMGWCEGFLSAVGTTGDESRAIVAWLDASGWSSGRAIGEDL